MKVLVTGHHGYIGSVVAPMLAEAGHEVTGSTRSSTRGATSSPTRSDHRPPRDVREVDAGDLEGFDAIVHLAALSNDPLGELERGADLEINLRGTVELARGAKEARA